MSPDGSCVRLLIVDESTEARARLGEIFVGQGWEVAGEASNARDAVDLYAAVAPDVVITEIALPDGDGFGLAEEIVRANPRAAIVVCSALAQADSVLRAIRSGARDFIVKPFQCSRVIRGIQTVLGRVA